MMTRLIAALTFWLGAGMIPVLSPILHIDEDGRLRASWSHVASVGEGMRSEESTPYSDPFPVLIVPGWSDQVGDLEPLRQRFLKAGWPEEAVGVVGFADPFGSNADHAAEVARAVHILRARSESDRVDVVAHSMGGLATRYFLLFEGGGELVRRVVFLGTPHRGTVAAILAWGDGGREMVPGSSFLEKLNGSEDSIPQGVEALALRTAVDLRVIPASSAILPGVENVEVCCPSHTGMVDDDRTFEEVMSFLQRELATAASGS